MSHCVHNRFGEQVSALSEMSHPVQKLAMSHCITRRSSPGTGNFSGMHLRDEFAGLLDGMESTVIVL